MVFKDRVAIVTGGTRGIGRAIVLMLAREGADVAFTYLNSAKEAEVLSKQAQDLGRKCRAVQMDVRIFEN